MEHAQLKTDGSYSHHITTHGNVEWDANHFCPASALTAEEAALFRVVPLLEIPQPAYDAITQSCVRDGGELVGGEWRYKWTTSALSAEQAAAALKAAREVKNGEINAARLAATFSTFNHRSKPVSCDELSRSDIDGINGCVAINGAFPAIWPGVWKCADNSYLTIGTIDEWKAFYGAMVEAGSALYAHSQALKSALAAATTAEEIAAITW